MGFFGFGKKMEEKTKGGCCCGSAPAEEPACGGSGCHIKILGAGCKSCHEQHENVKKAVANMELDENISFKTGTGFLLSDAYQQIMHKRMDYVDARAIIAEM